MPDETTLPLLVANDIEANKNFSDIDTLNELVAYIAAHLAANGQPLLDSFPLEFTSGADRNDPDNGKVRFFSSPSQVRFGGNNIYRYPPNSIFISLEDPLPESLRELDDSEITNYGLTSLTAPAKWVIFEVTE